MIAIGEVPTSSVTACVAANDFTLPRSLWRTSAEHDTALLRLHGEGHSRFLSIHLNFAKLWADVITLPHSATRRSMLPCRHRL